jgi:acyl-coenzyme A synthetase/AMP-(fatty) acid ligase
MHEYPKEIEFLDELPETPDGKIQRKKLKEKEYRRKQKKIPSLSISKTDMKTLRKIHL